jgi:hypothetical protein
VNAPMRPQRRLTDAEWEAEGLRYVREEDVAV